MTKKQKIQCLALAMTLSERSNGTSYHHFTDEAPEELKDLFLSRYQVRDQDYDIFSSACDVFSSYDIKDIQDGNIDDDFSSPYTSDRLACLTVWNQNEITNYIRNSDCDIQEACASWYNDEVRNAVNILLEWINSSK